MSALIAAGAQHIQVLLSGAFKFFPSVIFDPQLTESMEPIDTEGQSSFSAMSMNSSCDKYN